MASIFSFADDTTSYYFVFPCCSRGRLVLPPPPPLACGHSHNIDVAFSSLPSSAEINQSINPSHLIIIIITTSFKRCVIINRTIPKK